MGQSNADIFQNFTEYDRKSECLMVEIKGFFGVLHGDCNVIEFLKHVPD